MPEPQNDPASSTTPEQRAKELGITDTSPEEGVNQADLDRGAELDDQHGWSGEGPRCGGRRLTEGEFPDECWVLTRASGRAGGPWRAFVPEPIPDGGQAVRRYVPAPSGTVGEGDEADLKALEDDRDYWMELAEKYEKERDSRLTKELLSSNDVGRLELIRDHDGNDLSPNDCELLNRLIDAFGGES